MITSLIFMFLCFNSGLYGLYTLCSAATVFDGLVGWFIIIINSIACAMNFHNYVIKIRKS